jgi:DNA-binding NtrC family response regulator
MKTKPDGIRMMIVDDEIPLLNALEDSLGAEGFQVSAFTDPAKAVAAFKPGRIDLVLSDLEMPGMDGIELLGRCLKIDPNLVGVIMTGCGSVRPAVHAMQTGAADYILKPFHIRELLAILDRALGVQRAIANNAHSNGEIFCLSQTSSSDG